MQKKQLRGEAKREAILEIALDAFLKTGFAGTSMATIAAKVGGSKGTLYSFFSSKEELFISVLDARIERYGAPVRAAIKAEGPPETVLTDFGTKLVKAILTPLGIAIQRLIIAEAERFPEIARAFYERGPMRTEAELTGYFARLMREGRLREADPHLLALHFTALCRTGLHEKGLWNMLGPVEDSVVEANVRAAVATILAANAPLA